ncbi:MAG: universal stress protein [Dehalococcoidia bacterium]
MAIISGPIVVPLDGSKNAEEAVAPAATLAKAAGVAVRFVHVLDGEQLTTAADRSRASEIFQAYVARLAAANGLPEASVSNTVLDGNAAKEVIDFAKDAAIIVLATHGRSGLRASLIGSVADKIVRGAKVPVLAIPLGGADPFSGKPFVVAVDGSPASEKGLALGRTLAGAFTAKVCLVRAYSIPPPAGIELVTYPVDLSTTLKEAAEEYLAKAAQPGESIYCEMSAPVDAIDAVSKAVDAAIVVVTSHGKGFATRIALGSVTERVLHTVRRPVLVVPVSAL